MTGSQLRFGLLGPLAVSVADTPVPLGTPKQRAVMAMLLINRNRAVGTESLIDATWGESPVPAARTSIQSYVSNLRRALANAGVDACTVLASAPPGYRLRVDDGDCDLDRFISQKNAGMRAAAGQSEQASSSLTAALDQWRGPALDDLRNFAFVEAFGTALTEDLMLVHITSAEAEIDCGRANTVIGELETRATKDPYHEPLWAKLITAYYVAGSQSDALEAYRRLKTALVDDLGIEPSPSVNLLHARILRQERLDAAKAVKTTAKRAMTTAHTAFTRKTAASLRDTAGAQYSLRSTATRIGRLPDNDIVFEGDDISKHHAVIFDIGGSFVISDLGSANGVQVQRQLLRPSAALADGDHLTICGYEFVFEIQRA